jgi:excisionase family DNA binding protein
MKETKLLTTAEAGARLGVSGRTVQRAVRNGLLRAKLGGIMGDRINRGSFQLVEGYQDIVRAIAEGVQKNTRIQAQGGKDFAAETVALVKREYPGLFKD